MKGGVWLKAVFEPSLTRRLLFAQLGLLVVLWLASIAYFVYDVAYVNDWYEPRQMRNRADMILSVIDGMEGRPAELRQALQRIDEFQRDENRENDAEGVRVSLNAWRGDELLYATPGEPGVIQVSKFDDLEISDQNGRRIRSFARRSASSAARVVIILPADAPSVFLTFWSSGIVLLPLLISMPLLLLPAWLSIRLALRPFRDLTQQVAEKGTGDLSPLKFRAVHRELRPLAASVNGLLGRLQQGIARERQFVADAAHELRTPLAALRINVEALRERSTGGTEGDSLLTSLQSSTERATRLVSQLLSLMRSDVAGDSPQAVSLCLPDLVQECMATLAPLAREAGVELELTSTGTHSTVRGDRESLISLVNNLVENAIKYTPSGTRVLVEVTGTADSVELAVSDEGPGIPVELQQRVLERFYRVASQSQTGSGLGLAIVQSVAAKFGAVFSMGVPTWGYGLLVRVRFRADQR
jgi:signal transduction histidine kinase